MRLKKAMVIGAAIVMAAVLPCVALGGENKVTKKVEDYDSVMALAETIRGLRAELLNWQKKYYVEKSTRLQLQAMNTLCTNPEFHENYGLIMETDKKLKQTQLVGGETK